ncbi:hypothetical protein WA026_014185 [Henosepilachna vigintioctopunctata]|uniref:Lipase domain-containing protein n=1 Tax=Henosepilachna vigintioctopunctata TaxID=420089 RepID=A0AAW1TTT2_9CUCU
MFLKSIFFLLFVNENIVLSNDEVENITGEAGMSEMPLFSECFDEIGCIEVTKEWYHPTYRPVNKKPLKRHVIKTEFLIVAVDDNDTLVFEKASANPKSINSAGYQKESDVIIAIHDFTSDGYTGWIKHLSSSVLTKYVANMISVDWQAGAEPPFDQAIANARLVALEIIAFINSLLRMGALKDDIHLVGHGVGAHIAGYVGSRINGLKKISALDPTGPRFQFMPEIVRLHSGCAKYVEVLHTDSFEGVSQGTSELMGDADFFINNAHLQPGCKELGHHSLVEIGRQELLPGQIVPGCSHKRSFKYFIESIENRDCIFIGMRCDNYEKFSKGECNSCSTDGKYDTCITFGLLSKHSVSPNFSYFLNTADESPYCMYAYAVSIELEINDQVFNGIFEIDLHDINEKEVKLTFPNQEQKYRTYESKSRNRYLYYARHPKLGRFKQAKVKWMKKKSVLQKFMFKKSEIPVKRIMIEPVTRGTTLTTLFKPVENGGTIEIPSGQYRLFDAYEVISDYEPEIQETSPTSMSSLSTTTKHKKKLDFFKNTFEKLKEKAKNKKP